MMFSKNAGPEPVFVRVIIYSMSFPASTLVHPDAVFVAVIDGKLTSNGISITGRGFGAAVSSLKELYAKFVRGTSPIPVTQPTGLVASTSTVKSIANVFFPEPEPR